MSESSKQEDFSHLASIKALVTDMEALKEHMRRSSHLVTDMEALREHMRRSSHLVTDMEALKEHMRRSSHLLEVIIGLFCLNNRSLLSG